MKHKGEVANVPRLIVKLVALTIPARRGAARPVSAVVLQVTDSRVPTTVDPVGWMRMSLLVVTAVVATVQVPVEAFVAQEKAPAGAAPQATSDGLAPDPATEQFVVVFRIGTVRGTPDTYAVPAGIVIEA